jgi:hypothetical protein
MIAPVGETNGTQRRVRDLAAGPSVHACVHQGQLDVFSRVQALKQIEVLENETDLSISYCGQVVRSKPGSIDAINPALPARGSIKASHYSHEGRFA